MAGCVLFPGLARGIRSVPGDPNAIDGEDKDMNDEGRKLDRLLEELKQQRDELRLKMHLAQAEIRDEWDALEKKWEQMKPRLDTVQREAAKTSKNVLAALELGVEELREGYQRIRGRLE